MKKLKDGKIKLKKEVGYKSTWKLVVNSRKLGYVSKYIY